MFTKHIESLINKDTSPATKEQIVYAILESTAANLHKDILIENINLIPALINLLRQKDVTYTTKQNIAQIIVNLTNSHENSMRILKDNPNFGKILNDFLERTDVPPEATQYALKTLGNFIPTFVNLLQHDKVNAATKQQALRGILKFSENADNYTVILKNHENIIQILMNNFIETHIEKITETTEATSILAKKIIIKLVKLESPIKQHDKILENYRNFIPSLIRFLEDEKATSENKQFAMHLIHKLSPTLVLGLDKKNSKQVTEDDAAKALTLLATSSTNPEKIIDRNPVLINVLIKLLNSNQTKLKVQECAISMVEKIASHPASRKKLNVNECDDIISSLTFLSLHPNTSEISKAEIATTISQLKNDQGTKSTVITSQEGSNKRVINAQDQEGNKKLKLNKFTNYLPETFKKN